MMNAKLYLILLAVLLAVSVPVGAEVVSINFEANGQTINPLYGDVDLAKQGVSFTTGTNTEWNVLMVGTSGTGRTPVTSGPLTTMEGLLTAYDVTFTLGYEDLGETYQVLTSDIVRISSGALHFKYSGLVPGYLYDIRCMGDSHYANFTFGETSSRTNYTTGTVTFTGVTADPNGVIEGRLNVGAGGERGEFGLTQIRGAFDTVYGIPNRKVISSAVDTPLSWTNLAPADPNNTDVYVKVYCDQNNPPTTLVAEGSGSTTSGATVDTTALGTFYWIVDTYLDGNGTATGDITTGIVYTFESWADAPVESVDAGADMISWSGEPVELSSSVVDDGKSEITYSWSVDPNTGVVLTEVPDDGDDLTSNAANPTVTITKATNNPSIVTLTFAVHDAGNPETIVEDSMRIDLYDDACKAAIAAGQLLAGDLDADCITSLSDFAIMAETWLIDTSLPGPVAP